MSVITQPVADKTRVLILLKDNQPSLRALGVKQLGLFGSFVRGEQRSDSDVDLLVEFNPGEKTFDHFIALSLLLEDLLQRRVELVTPESLSPYIAPHIMREVEYAFVSG